MLKSTLVEALIFPFLSELQEPRIASKQNKLKMKQVDYKNWALRI